MYYLVLSLLESEPSRYGKYGRMRLRYFQVHHPLTYEKLLFEGKLIAHLNKIDDTTNARMELLIRQMQEQQGITEELKARDQMAWVGAMHNIRAAVEEIIMTELVYD